MKFLSILLAGLVAFDTASGYVIQVYLGRNCSGRSRRVNVWDNTCADPNFPRSRSARVVNFSGRKHQRARFYSGTRCVSGRVVGGPWYADVTNHGWRRGNCIDFQGLTARSYQSADAFLAGRSVEEGESEDIEEFEGEDYDWDEDLEGFEDFEGFDLDDDLEEDENPEDESAGEIIVKETAVAEA